MISIRRSPVRFTLSKGRIWVYKAANIITSPYILAGTGRGNILCSHSPANDITRIIANCFTYFIFFLSMSFLCRGHTGNLRHSCYVTPLMFSLAPKCVNCHSEQNHYESIIKGRSPKKPVNTAFSGLPFCSCHQILSFNLTKAQMQSTQYPPGTVRCFPTAATKASMLSILILISEQLCCEEATRISDSLNRISNSICHQCYLFHRNK